MKNSKQYRLAIIYDSGRRYIVPFEIAEKTLKISKEDKKKLEIAIKREIAKGI